MGSTRLEARGLGGFAWIFASLFKPGPFGTVPGPTLSENRTNIDPNTNLYFSILIQVLVSVWEPRQVTEPIKGVLLLSCFFLLYAPVLIVGNGVRTKAWLRPDDSGLPRPVSHSMHECRVSGNRLGPTTVQHCPRSPKTAYKNCPTNCPKLGVC